MKELPRETIIMDSPSEWFSLPDIEYISKLRRRRAYLKYRMRLKELEIKTEEIPVRRKNPRKPEERDAVTMHLQEQLAELEYRLNQIEEELGTLELKAHIWTKIPFEERII